MNISTTRIDPRFNELVRQTDKIDAANLTLEEILHPEQHPYILASMTICTGQDGTMDYCGPPCRNCCSTRAIDSVLEDHAVKCRSARVVSQNKAYKNHFESAHPRAGRGLDNGFPRVGSRAQWQSFSGLFPFPETVVNMKIFNEKSKTVVKLGHSIINPGCRVNVGGLLATYGGGGHRGAGACRLETQDADTAIDAILDVLVHRRQQA